jgi:microcystin-dependent protein
MFNFSKCENIEKFANNKDIDDIIADNYKMDFLSIRELSNISQKILKNGLTIPSNVNILNNINSIPKGTIIAHYYSSIPYGWVLCDGNNGTPDLRGRFVRMWNDNLSGFDSENKLKVNNTDANLSFLTDTHNSYSSVILKHKFKSYGGTDVRNFSNFNELPIHTHAITSDGEHQHAAYKMPYWNGSFEGGGGDQQMYTTDGGDPTQFKSISEFKHNHTLNNVGASEEFNNMPPYYVITWIMKT